MRKAFDANVPKLRPRLKGAVTAVDGEGLSTEPAADPAQAPAEGASPEGARPEGALEGQGELSPAPGASPDSEAPRPVGELPLETESLPSPDADGVEAAAPQPLARASLASPSVAEAPDLKQRRDKLLEVKRKVAAAARPTPPVAALPDTPARTGESALALLRDLEAQLERAREVELALREELDEARAGLARGAADTRRAAERGAALESQVEQKRALLEEMLVEMRALEEERDGAVARAQALSALDEERQAVLDGLSSRAEEAEKVCRDAEGEMKKL
ncbi:MAG TPA: hypothetical protein VMK12_22900, partial [Anaeromyxobacteraceae bacterium]|nr:hypothetical protein [Anaeromyxobacteraceae bacterium]